MTPLVTASLVEQLHRQVEREGRDDSGSGLRRQASQSLPHVDRLYSRHDLREFGRVAGQEVQQFWSQA